MQLDVVPVIERHLDRIGRNRIPFPHVVHGRIGEHHPPAESVIGLVAFHNRDLMRRIQLLHQDRKIQPCGASADTYDAHAIAPSGLSRPASRTGRRCGTGGFCLACLVSNISYLNYQVNKHLTCSRNRPFTTTNLARRPPVVRLDGAPADLSTWRSAFPLSPGQRVPAPEPDGQSPACARHRSASGPLA